MRKTLRITSFLAVFALALILSSSALAQGKKLFAEGTPTRAIQDLDNKLDDFKTKEKGKSLSKEDEEFNRNLKREIIHGTFDIRELARLSLGKHWEPLTEAQRDEFVTILTDLLEVRALFSKEQSAAKSKSGGKYYVIYRGDKPIAEGKSFVQTKVTVPSENITININYRLKKKGSEWMIYDIIVDESSLVDNYKYQFNSIITKSGYADLVNRMNKKLTELKADRDAS